MSDDLERRLAESLQGDRLPDAPDTLRAFLERLPVEAELDPAASRLHFGWLAPLVVIVVAALVIALVPRRTAPPTSSPSPGVSLTSGISWRQVAGPGDIVVDGDVVMDVAAFGDGFVMVGEGGRASFAVWWSSPDGLHWQRHDADPVFAGSLLQWVVHVPDGLLIVGSSNAVDGLCAGGVFGCNPVMPLRMWTSSDGRAWQRLSDHAVDVFGRAALGVVAAGPNGLVAFGIEEPAKGNGTPMVWTSTDGRTWSMAPQLYTAYPDAEVNDVVATSTTFIAVGRKGEEGGPSAPGAVWYSSDGRTWHAATTEPSSELSFARAGAHGALAYSFPAVGSPVIWTTTDGSVWRRATDLPFEVIGHLSPGFVADGLQILAIALGGTTSTNRGAWISDDGQHWRAIPANALPPFEVTEGTLGAIGPRGVVMVALGYSPLRSSPTSLWFGSFGFESNRPSSLPGPGSPACGAERVRIQAGWEGATGSLAGVVAVTNTGPSACLLSGPPGIRLVAGDMPVDVAITNYPGLSADVPQPAPPVVLKPGQQAQASLNWSNWCGAPFTHVEVEVTLPGDSQPVAASYLGPGGGVALMPRCDAPGSKSSVSVFAFAPAS